MYVAIKEEEDSDIEIVTPDDVNTIRSNNFIKLATELMSIGKTVPKIFPEFQVFVKDNIKWQPHPHLIYELWQKLCSVEEEECDIDSCDGKNVPNHTESALQETPCVGKSLATEDKSSNLEKSHKTKTSISSQSFTISGSDDSDLDESHIPSKSLSPSKDIKVKEEPDLENLYRDIFSPVAGNSSKTCQEFPSTGKKRGKKSKSFGLARNDSSCSADSPSNNADQSSILENGVSLVKLKKKKSIKKSEMNTSLPSSSAQSDCKEVSKKSAFKEKTTRKRHSMPETDEVLTDSSYHTHSDCGSSAKKKRKSKADRSVCSKCKKNNRSLKITDEEVKALREELLIDKIIELELPDVIRKMRNALTKETREK